MYCTHTCASQRHTFHWMRDWSPMSHGIQASRCRQALASVGPITSSACPQMVGLQACSKTFSQVSWRLSQSMNTVIAYPSQMPDTPDIGSTSDRFVSAALARLADTHREERVRGVIIDVLVWIDPVHRHVLAVVQTKKGGPMNEPQTSPRHIIGSKPVERRP